MDQVPEDERHDQFLSDHMSAPVADDALPSTLSIFKPEIRSNLTDFLRCDEELPSPVIAAFAKSEESAASEGETPEEHSSPIEAPMQPKPTPFPLSRKLTGYKAFQATIRGQVLNASPSITSKPITPPRLSNTPLGMLPRGKVSKPLSGSTLVSISSPTKDAPRQRLKLGGMLNRVSKPGSTSSLRVKKDLSRKRHETCLQELMTEALSAVFEKGLDSLAKRTLVRFQKLLWEERLSFEHQSDSDEEEESEEDDDEDDDDEAVDDHANVDRDLDDN
jgi:hypothetical protein